MNGAATDCCKNAMHPTLQQPGAPAAETNELRKSTSKLREW